MIKLTNKFILFLCLLAIRSSLFAASEAEFGTLSKTWTLHADGSQEFRCSKELTLFTHTAMNGTYGESFIVYNPQYQELKIHSSYTKQKDGTIVKTPDNAFVEVLPRFASDAPAYNHLKEMVVVHTGLELGATIYLDYSILTKAGYYPELDIREMIQESSPIKACNITVSVPAEKSIAWEMTGNKASAKESVRNGAKEIRWTLRNIPALPREAFMPANKNNLVTLTASTYGSVKEALQSLNKAVKATQDYEAKAFAQYLTEKASSPKEKIELLKNHVINHIGLSGVPPYCNGYTYRDADEVLRSAYGTSLEKSILLNSMLNAAGITSELIVSMPANISSHACGQQAFANVYVKATVDGAPCYLSAERSGDLPISWRGDLDKVYSLDGTEIKVEARPIEVKENKTVEVNAGKAVGGVVICTLPNASKGVDNWRMAPLNSRRMEMFELPSLINEEIVYTVTTGKGMKLMTETTPVVLTKPCGKVTRTITQKGDKVEVVRTIELNKLQLTPSEYNDLRSLMNEWSDPNNRLLLFAEE